MAYYFIIDIIFLLFFPEFYYLFIWIMNIEYTLIFVDNLVWDPSNNKFIIVKELQTIIRDKTTSRSDFKFVADRLIRMVIEEGLNQLPYTKCDVTTPTGCNYSGLR